jgi:arylsulfatase A-like enzyme
LLAILTVLFALSTAAVNVPYPTSGAVNTRPNFVMIMVDDLDMSSVAKMPAVRKLIASQGATFSQYFATTPLCCPARASILRGQYAHNHGVLRNTGDDAGFTAFHERGHESDSLATILHAAGYQTALIGKYLNGYSPAGGNRTYIPPGWDTWVAGVNHDAYSSFNYELNVNGELVKHGRDESDYITDVLSGHALDFLDRAAGTSSPFFLYLAPYAPHAPSIPAPRHEGQFSGASAPRTPAFNTGVRGKADWVRTSSRLDNARIAKIDQGYQDALESLQAVDEMVQAVVHRLEEYGLLESTYVLFLSDNGQFLGEYRQPHGKDAPYDAAARVPLMIRGPRIASGVAVERIALNIDLLPTFTDLAGLPTPGFVDGRSLVPLLTGNDRHWRVSALIEGFGKETESNEGGEQSTPSFRALRTEEILYVEYETRERELYDLRQDPYQIANIAERSPETLLSDYSRHLDALATCSGRGCHRLEDTLLAGVSDGSRRAKQPGRAANQPPDLVVPAVDGVDISANRRLPVGGEENLTAQVHLRMPKRARKSGRLYLRVFVNAVDRQGTLVAALESPSSEMGPSGGRKRQRLGGVPVNARGWVELDVSGALDVSGPIIVTLRARDGAAVTVSTEQSEKAPELVPSRDRAQGTDNYKKHKKQKAKRKRDVRGQQRDRARPRNPDRPGR